MQIGYCPHGDCDDFRMRLLPEHPLPLFSKEECPGCKRTIWVLYSRVDPQVFTEEDFARQYEVNEQTKAIRARAA